MTAGLAIATFVGVSAAFTAVAQCGARRIPKVRIVRLRTLPVFALTAAGALVASPSEHALPVIVALAAVAVCAISDVQCGYVFDGVSIGAAAAIVALCAVGGNVAPALVGAASASGVLAALWGCSKGRGIGLGDVKLAAAIGAAFGPLDSVIVLGIAFVAGATVAVAGVMAGRLRRGDALPFVPYIGVGTLCCVFVPGHAP